MRARCERDGGRIISCENETIDRTVDLSNERELGEVDKWRSQTGWNSSGNFESAGNNRNRAFDSSIPVVDKCRLLEVGIYTINKYI